ncbi:MAG TPA: DUF6788 family protein [Thermoleophilia bacterium]|nr:DUF6788 family protein [Thermoleophilia bacterium]
MTRRQRSQLEARRERLLGELRQLPDLMRGKVFERERKCGSPSCPCASGGPRHRGLQLTVNLKGRTRTRYVRQGEREAVEAKVRAYRRLWALVEELTEVNLALFNAIPLGEEQEE